MWVRLINCGYLCKFVSLWVKFRKYLFYPADITTNTTLEMFLHLMRSQFVVVQFVCFWNKFVNLVVYERLGGKAATSCKLENEINAGNIENRRLELEDSIISIYILKRLSNFVKFTRKICCTDVIQIICKTIFLKELLFLRVWFCYLYQFPSESLEY